MTSLRDWIATLLLGPACPHCRHWRARGWRTAQGHRVGVHGGER